MKYKVYAVQGVEFETLEIEAFSNWYNDYALSAVKSRPVAER